MAIPYTLQPAERKGSRSGRGSPKFASIGDVKVFLQVESSSNSNVKGSENGRSIYRLYTPENSPLLVDDKVIYNGVGYIVEAPYSQDGGSSMVRHKEFRAVAVEP